MNQRFPDEADGVTHVSASLSPALHYLTCTITAWLRQLGRGEQMIYCGMFDSQAWRITNGLEKWREKVWRGETNYRSQRGRAAGRDRERL